MFIYLRLTPQMLNVPVSATDLLATDYSVVQSLAQLCSPERNGGSGSIRLFLELLHRRTYGASEGDSAADTDVDAYADASTKHVAKADADLDSASAAAAALFESFQATYNCVLSDGATTINLLPYSLGLNRPEYVQHHDRWAYARAVVSTRLHEAGLQMEHIRRGFFSVVPPSATRVLSWTDLQRKVCGLPNVDMAVLRARTVYSPSFISEKTHYIVWFWSILERFDQGRYLHVRLYTCLSVCMLLWQYAYA